MASLSPELAAALTAQLQYYRDLGIFDFYRRAGGEAGPVLEAMEAAMMEAAPIQREIVEVEDAPIAARKSASKMAAVVPVAIPAGEGYAGVSGTGSPALLAIREEIGECTRCKLCGSRNKIVFGDGNAKARLMFVGEGPGADEDAQGVPFVGRAGQLLNNMIQAMGLKREQVYIANIVKCRPPQNRVPEPDEANTCMPFLEQQIAAIQPEVIVALGSTAATYLLGGKSALGALRGRVHASRQAKLIVTYHPAFLLRDPRQKKEAWADLKMAMAELGLSAPSGPPA